MSPNTVRDLRVWHPQRDRVKASKTAPRQRANAVNPRGLADWIGVDYE